MTGAQSPNQREPTPDATTGPFWFALRAGCLVVPRCDTCHRYSFPPMGSCPHCGGPSTTLARVSGRGTIYSWATVHVPLSPEFVDDVPYTVVVVELREGPRVFGRLVGGQGPEAGADVEFTPVGDGNATVPGFRPAANNSAEPEVQA